MKNLPVYKHPASYAREPVCPIRKANPYRRMQKAIRTNNTAEKEAAKKRTAAAEARKQAKADKKKK